MRRGGEFGDIGGRGIAYKPSCCKVVKLLLHFMAQTISSVRQCGVTGAENFGDVKNTGSQEAKLMALSTQARCRAAPAAAATASSVSEADASSTWRRALVERAGIGSVPVSKYPENVKHLLSIAACHRPVTFHCAPHGGNKRAAVEGRALGATALTTCCRVAVVAAAQKGQVVAWSV